MEDKKDDANLPQGDLYKIRLTGQLPTDWSDWPDGLAITSEAGGATVISVHLVDPAAVQKLLAKLRDLNLEPISVTRIGPEGTTFWPL